MCGRMRRVRKEVQIFESVVTRVVIFVVDDLFSPETPAEMLLHHDPVNVLIIFAAS